MAVGYTLKRLLSPRAAGGLAIAAMVSAFLPDADVLAFAFGIPYEHWLGHRGFTHSLLFAGLWSGLLTALFFRSHWRIAWLVLFLATASHGLLDAMTDGGRGVAFFAPFDNDRYFLPFRPIRVSPLGIGRFFSERGLEVIFSELLWIGLPCVVALVLQKLLIKREV